MAADFLKCNWYTFWVLTFISRKSDFGFDGKILVGSEVSHKTFTFKALL